MVHSFCLKIDDIASISKATLYKDFSTRDEIVEVVVAHYIDYLSEADAIVQDENVSFTERFQKTFEQSLKCVSSMYLNCFLTISKNPIHICLRTLYWPNKIVTKA
jgi:AcrR family transcriptional regulator